MNSPAVVNASPLIYLARTNLLHLLQLAAPEVLIDDLEGRRCAETFGIRLRGTLGLVLRARRQNVIPEARPILQALRAAGMYLSDRVVDTALAEIGE